MAAFPLPTSPSDADIISGSPLVPVPYRKIWPVSRIKKECRNGRTAVPHFQFYILWSHRKISIRRFCHRRRSRHAPERAKTINHSKPINRPAATIYLYYLLLKSSSHNPTWQGLVSVLIRRQSHNVGILMRTSAHALASTPTFQK